MAVNSLRITVDMVGKGSDFAMKTALNICKKMKQGRKHDISGSVYQKLQGLFLYTLLIMILPMISCERSIEAYGQETVLSIDYQHCYEGMERAYSDGYIPTVEQGTAYVVLPVISSEPLKEDCLTSSIRLGEPAAVPFVYKNFEKNTQRYRYQVGEETADCFLIFYALELKEDRQNGSYPVTISCTGQTLGGETVQNEFTVYVTITDGKNPMSEEDRQKAEQEAAAFPPIPVVEETVFSVDEIKAGEAFTITVRLKNSSTSQGLENLSVFLNSQSDMIQLTGSSDRLYVGALGIGETKEISCTVLPVKETVQGYYTIGLQMSYADSKGNLYSDNGNVRFFVHQPCEISFDPLIISPQAQVGDRITAELHAMNLGRSRIYNVRAIIEADGLTPETTLFIGNLEAGSEGQAGVRASVWGLTKAEDRYGLSKGVVTCYYENADGVEMTTEMPFQIDIQSPFTADYKTQEQKQDRPRQWWVIIAVLSGLIIVTGGVLVFTGRYRKKENE